MFCVGFYGSCTFAEASVYSCRFAHARRPAPRPAPAAVGGGGGGGGAQALAAGAFAVGARVLLRGLVTHPQYNGLRGAVRRADGGRLHVRLDRDAAADAANAAAAGRRPLLREV